MTKPETLVEMIRRINSADPATGPTREEWRRVCDSIVAMKAGLEWWASEHGCCSGYTEDMLAHLDAPRGEGGNV